MDCRTDVESEAFEVGRCEVTIRPDPALSFSQPHPHVRMRVFTRCVAAAHIHQPTPPQRRFMHMHDIDEPIVSTSLYA